MREPQALWVALDWITAHCIVPDGFRKGRPFRPYTYQEDYLRAFYTVRGDAEYDPAAPILASAFVHRRGLLVGPQKIGKNPMIAAQTCLEGVGPSLFAGWAEGGEQYRCADWGCGCGMAYTYAAGEPMGVPRPTPLVEITAYSEDSTDNTYLALRPMIDQGPLHDLIPHTGEDFMRLPDLYGTGFDPDQACRINTVTSSPGSRLGGRVTFAPQDEVGIWTTANGMVKLADTQYRNLAGMGGRASLTTNAWDPAQVSVAKREYESAAEDVYRQFIEPPKNLSYTDKRDRHKIHQAVYPTDVRRENGGHVELESIEAEAADLVTKDAAQAARFFGNLLVAGSGTAVEADVWDQQGPPAVARRTIAPGTRIALGFDGSVSEDSTVLRGCTEDGYRFSLPDWSWVRPKGEAMADWAAAHPGEPWRVPDAEVDAAVRDAFGRFDVGRMECDAAFWRDYITSWQRLYGEKVVIPRDTNSVRVIVPIFDRWRSAVRRGNAPHDGDPVVTEHVKALHAGAPRDGQRLDDGRVPVVPKKGDDKRKIDGALADMLAYDAAMTMPEAEAEVVRNGPAFASF